MWNKYSSLELIVTKSIAKLIARVTKLGWDIDERHQQLSKQLDKFFEVIIIISFVNHLVVINIIFYFYFLFFF